MGSIRVSTDPQRCFLSPATLTSTMTGNAKIHALLCLLVLAAQSHCVLAHGELLKESVAAECQSQLPLQPSESACENESGCICKGAIGIHTPVVSLDDGFTEWLAKDLNCGSTGAPNYELDTFLLDASFIGTRPRCLHDSARARAFLQSYQL